MRSMATQTTRTNHSESKGINVIIVMGHDNHLKRQT